MRYLIEHETILEYPAAVREHHIELRLRPREDAHQRVLSCEITLEPATSQRTHVDYFGNNVTACEIIAPHRRLLTRMKAEVENTLTNPFNYPVPPVSSERDIIRAALRDEPRLYDYILSRSPATPNLEQLSEQFQFPCHESGRSLLESVQQAMEWVFQALRYEPGVTSIHTSLTEALQTGAGVCQDFSHLLIAIIRSWKIPARYVMGYLALPEDETSNMPPATHAWAEIFIPGRGWTGFDATQRLLTNELFIPVAVGRDYLDAAPQRGSFKGDAAGEKPLVNVSIVAQ